MLCKYYWIVLYTVRVIAFCLRGPFFSGHGVHTYIRLFAQQCSKKVHKVSTTNEQDNKALSCTYGSKDKTKT